MKDLLAGVLAAPDDFAARRVLADALLQTADHDPRGELIHIQCELEDRRDAELERRAAALLAKHGAAWTAKLRPLAKQLVWRRGFVEGVTCSALQFAQQGSTLVKLTPLRALIVKGPLRVEEMAKLVKTKALAQIRSLTISVEKLGKKHVQTLADAPVVANLERLVLEGFTGDAAARALANSPHLGNLRELSLAGCGIEPAGAEALAASKGLRELVRLDLSSNGFSARGAHPIINGSWPALRALDLSSTQLGKQGGEIVAKATRKGLRELGLRSNGLDSSFAQLFAAAKGYPDLELLDVAANSITAFPASRFRVHLG